MWRGDHSRGRLLVLISMLSIAAACTDGGASPPRDQPSDPTAFQDEATPTHTDSEAGCEIPAGEPFIESATVELSDLGEVDGVRVSAAVYPHPEYEGKPWSQWGQGMAIADGRFYSAIGDHHAEDGNSYVYEYDPGTGSLTMIGDVLSYVDHVEGTWGYGKIHSQMVPGPCGEIYFSTYWGSSRDIEFEGEYTGDILFRLDPFGRTLQPLEVPVEFHGQASMGGAPQHGVVFGEAVDPLTRDELAQGPFFAYDVVGEEVVFTGPAQPHVGYRSILVDSDGVAYYSIGGGALQTYDPSSGESVTHNARMPGDWLRAVTTAAPDGSVYGVTREPDTFFAMRTDGSIEPMGAALGYTASMAISPDGSRFFYMPGAHGDSGNWGSPLVAVDTATGEENVVAELFEIVEESMGYRVGGTYNVAVSADGDTVYMGVNAGPEGSGESFGEVLLLVLDLP